MLTWVPLPIVSLSQGCVLVYLCSFGFLLPLLLTCVLQYLQCLEAVDASLYTIVPPVSLMPLMLTWVPFCLLFCQALMLAYVPLYLLCLEAVVASVCTSVPTFCVVVDAGMLSLGSLGAGWF